MEKNTLLPRVCLGEQDSKEPEVEIRSYIRMTG